MVSPVSISRESRPIHRDPAAGRGITLFTWNVHRNAVALEVACRHLAIVPGCVIACFQELPENVYAWQIPAWSSDRLSILGRLPVPGGCRLRSHVVFVGSRGIRVDPDRERNHEGETERDSEGRCQGLSLSSRVCGFRDLQVLGIHGPDRFHSPTEKERSRWGRVMRDVLSHFWRGRPLVVLGDLNANPFHEEVTDRDGLFALRSKDILGVVRPRKLPHERRSAVPLHNPMWRLLPDDTGTHHGTYYCRNRARTELLWHCIDQILVSDDLVPLLAGRSPEILTRLSGEREVTLVDHHGAPLLGDKGPTFSDHFPVQLTIDIEEVKSCRISARP